MLEIIGRALDMLDEHLQTLWAKYLVARPAKWLWNLEHAPGELAEAKMLRDEIGDLQTRIEAMRHRIKHSRGFDPVRTDGPL